MNEIKTCLVQRRVCSAAYGQRARRYSRTSSDLQSVTGRSQRRAYSESDRALRDRGNSHAVWGGQRLAPPPAATAGLHGWPRQPGHRVRGSPPARPLFRAVPLNLGDLDRADPDLPDDRLLCRRPAGRSAPRRSPAVSDRRRRRAFDRGDPDRLAADPLAGPDRLRPTLGGARAGLADLGHHPVCGSGDPPRDGLAVRDPASHPAARDRRQCGRRGLCAVDVGKHPGDIHPGVLADSHVWDPPDHLYPGVCARHDFGGRPSGRRPPPALSAAPGPDRSTGALWWRVDPRGGVRCPALRNGVGLQLHPGRQSRERDPARAQRGSGRAFGLQPDLRVHPRLLGRGAAGSVFWLGPDAQAGGGGRPRRRDDRPRADGD